MNFKEFRQHYGKSLPLSVCKSAFTSVSKGKEMKSSILRASREYAQTLKDRPLRGKLFGYYPCNNIITVAELMTERKFYNQDNIKKLPFFLAKDNYFSTEVYFPLRYYRMAKYGENFDLRIHSFRIPKYSTLGIYRHWQGNILVFVVLENSSKSQNPQLKEIANTIAKNILYYSIFYSALEYAEMKTTEQFVEKLLNEPIRMISLNRRIRTIGDYLRAKSKELETELKIVDIKTFGC